MVCASEHSSEGQLSPAGSVCVGCSCPTRCQAGLPRPPGRTSGEAASELTFQPQSAPALPRPGTRPLFPCSWRWARAIIRQAGLSLAPSGAGAHIINSSSLGTNWLPLWQSQQGGQELVGPRGREVYGTGLGHVAGVGGTTVYVQWGVHSPAVAKEASRPQLPLRASSPKDGEESSSCFLLRALSQFACWVYCPQLGLGRWGIKVHIESVAFWDLPSWRCFRDARPQHPAVHRPLPLLHCHHLWGEAQQLFNSAEQPYPPVWARTRQHPALS